MAERQVIRLRQPPPTQDKAMAEWQRQATDELNKLPPFSVFSFTTPESNVTAAFGTIGVSQSSGNTKLWVKNTGDGNTGWLPVSTLTAASGGTVYSVGTVPMRSDHSIASASVWYFCGLTPYQTAGTPLSFAPAGGTNSLRAFPFWSSSGLSVQAIAFRVQTAGSAGAVARVGIYTTSDMSSLYPGTLVAQSSETSTGASGILHEFSDFSANLEPQTLYWFAYLGGVASATINGWNTDYAWHILGRTAFSTHEGLGWSVAQSYGSLPSSFPAGGGKVGNLSIAIGVR